MHIVIVGNGKVGHTLSGMLSSEGHDVVIIDSDPESFRSIEADHDVQYIEGSGANYSVLESAGVAKSDLVIAVTNADELNILTCLIARKLGAESTIARIRDPELASQLHHIKQELGLTMSINPEFEAANEITRILHNPSVLKIDSFAAGKVEMVELKISETSPIAGKRIQDFRIFGLQHFVICAVEREGEVYIPNGSFVIQKNDKIFVSVETTNLSTLLNGFGMPKRQIKDVVIVGGGRISYYLARRLLQNNMTVRIIEKSEERCKFLKSELEKAIVIHGDGSSEILLQNEDIRGADAFVALTNIDEENLVMSLYALYKGASKVITKVNRLNYLEAFAHTDIDTVISPKMLTSEQIVKYVRAMSNTAGSAVRALYKLSGDRVEALEFEVDSQTKHRKLPLSKVPFKNGVLLACISRRNKVIIPRGDDFIQVGDVVVLVTKDHFVSSLNEIFES
ncbi:MAG: Trk system potassium transporter TrkA [Bacillota bacterium]|nr:Trk system potassium transporter TrkA [Bacillota bacterium]